MAVAKSLGFSGVTEHICTEHQKARELLRKATECVTWHHNAKTLIHEIKIILKPAKLSIPYKTNLLTRHERILQPMVIPFSL